MKITAILHFIAMIFLSTITQAQDLGNVSGAFRIEHRNVVYILSNNKTPRFDMATMTTLVNGEAQGTGLFEKLSNKTDTTTEGAIGKEIKGSSYITIQKTKSGVLLIWDTTVNDVVKKYPLQGKVTATLPMVITKGQWQDYVSGKSITIEATPEGQKIFMAAISKGIKQILDNGLKNGVDGIPVEYQLESVKLISKLQGEANSKAIKFPSIIVDYKVTVTLPLKLEF